MGFGLGIASVAAFLFGEWLEDFAVAIVLVRLWHVFNMRDPASPLLRNEITTNPHIWGAIGIGLALLLSAIYLPGLSEVLGLVAPSPREWLMILAASLIPLVVGQRVKLRARVKTGTHFSPAA